MPPNPDRSRPDDSAPCLGIVGGLGPLASAELLRTIYRENLAEREQTAPRCLLLSDPSFPDRTTALLRGERDELTTRLGRAVGSLLDQGATRVVVACFTIHAVLDELPSALRDRVISLIDLTIEELERDRRAGSESRSRLLLATTGTRRCGVFDRHPRWPEVAGAVLPLEDEDQGELHDLLYRLKRGADPATELPRVRALEERYGAAGSVFGCTELHLLHSAIETDHSAGAAEPIDALRALARRYAELIDR